MVICENSGIAEHDRNDSGRGIGMAAEDTSRAPSGGFSPIALSQMERVEAIRLASGNTLYALTFPTLFAWSAAERYEICLTDDAYVVRIGALGDDAYMFPCGAEEGKKRLIDALLPHGAPVFHCVRDEDRRFLEETYPERFLFTTCRDDYPYLYDRQAQVALAGKAYKGLRHQVNQGRAAARAWSVEALSAANVERAVAINREWARRRGEGGPADTAAAETALDHFEQLSMWGLLFQADGTDAAYVAGSFVTPEIYDVSFCKVLIAQCDCYVKWMLYKALPPEVTTVDSEEDMGLQGLRTHKLLRVPKELTRVWKGSFHA